MNGRITALYYACIDRFNLEDITLAEEYLVGCIAFQHRQQHGRADRDRIAEDFSLSRGLEKYEEELFIISRLGEKSLATLIASSLDFDKTLKLIETTYEQLQDSIYDETQASAQIPKFDRAIEILTRMKQCVKDKECTRKPNEDNTPSLFEE